MAGGLEGWIQRHSGVAALAPGVSACVAIAGGLLLATLNQQPIDQTGVGFSLPFLSFALVGTVLAWKRPENAIGWLLVGGSLAILLYGASEEYARYGLLTRPGSLVAAAEVSWFRTALWVPCAAVTIVYLPMLFPTGSVVDPRWRYVGWVAGIASAALMAVQWVASWPYRGPRLLDPAEAWIETSTLAGLVELIFPVLLVCGVLSIASLIRRSIAAAPQERMQIKWVLFSFSLFLAALLGDMLAPVETGPWAFASVVLIAVAFGVAVTRYRLYEIDRIISRTVTYAVVTAVLATIYLTAVLALGAVGQAALGEGSNDLVVALSTLLVAAAFQPVRRRVRDRVDRRFNRRRFDARQEVERFGGRLRDSLDLRDIVGETVTVARRAVEPALASVWVRPGGAP